MVISISKDQDYNRTSANYLEREIVDLCKTKNQVFIALSGGSTPLPILEDLRKRDLNWEQLHFFMVDERTVPINDPNSNYGAIDRIFFKHVSSKSSPMFHEGRTIDENVGAYEALLKEFVPLNNDGFPVFDLILLGMGDDGHTASLFPRTSALNENKRIVVRNEVPQLNTTRITLTYPAILSANGLIVLMKGEVKRQIYKEVISEVETSYPIQKIVTEYKNLKWIIQN